MDTISHTHTCQHLHHQPTCLLMLDDGGLRFVYFRKSNPLIGRDGMGFDACLRHGHCFASQVHLHSHICIVYVPVLAHLYTSKLHTCILPACTLPRFHKHICTLVCSSFAPTYTFTLPLLHTHTCMCTPTHYCTLPLAHSCTFTLPHTHVYCVRPHAHTARKIYISHPVSCLFDQIFNLFLLVERKTPKNS